jgi:hypothetical protein
MVILDKPKIIGGIQMKRYLGESRFIKPLMLVFIFTAALSLGLMQIIASSTPAPGSNQDPLVTKSYVDLKIAEALSSISASSQSSASTGSLVGTETISELEAKILELEGRLENFESEYNLASVAVSGEIQKTRFNVVQIHKGQKLLLGEGTEMILRSGIANAVSGPGGDMSNLTNGENVPDGSKITTNHLILSSREDGRGLIVISDYIWIMIKGSYKVVK